MALPIVQIFGSSLTSNELAWIQHVAGLTDPNADRILFWDDSAGTVEYLSVGSGLSISGTEITATASGANTALSNLASVAINTSLVSDTDNTDALGSLAIAWSDLFLGNGSVITWTSAASTSDVTLTHSSNALTLAGGVLAVPDAGITINSLPFAAADAGADAIYGWDDSAGQYENLTQAEARVVLGLGTAAYVATDLSDLNEATIEAAIDTLANLTSIQSLTITLADAGADALFGWDDSASAYQNLSQADARIVLGLGTAAYVATDLSDLNEATIETAIDTLANLTSIQGRTVTLADAGANAIFGWDDTAGAYENLTAAEAGAIVSPTVATRIKDGGADEIDAAEFGSGAAADGTVLTADGAGGAAWEAASGGSSKAFEVHNLAMAAHAGAEYYMTWTGLPPEDKWEADEIGVTETFFANGRLWASGSNGETYIKIRGNASPNSTAAQFNAGKNFCWTIALSFDNDTNVGPVGFGISTGNGSWDSSAATLKRVGFTSRGSPSTKAVTADGTTLTESADLDGNFTYATMNLWTVFVDDAADTAYFYINGVLRATLTTSTLLDNAGDMYFVFSTGNANADLAFNEFIFSYEK